MRSVRAKLSVLVVLGVAALLVAGGSMPDNEAELM